MTKKFGIIFDCDGTLVKSLDLGMGSYNYALEQLGERIHEPDEIKKYFGAGADRIFMQLLGDETKALKAFEYYFEHESKQVHKVFLHEGINELLDFLSQNHFPMGVVTGRHFRDLELIFNHHKLTRKFQALVCDNHLPKSKPAPDGILMACKKMQIAPENTFYIGDSTMDMIAAHAAGSKPIAALWDKWSKPHEMQNENPLLMARSPMEIASYIKSL